MAGLVETFNLDRSREVLKLRSVLNAAKFEGATKLSNVLNPEDGFEVLVSGHATISGRAFIPEKKRWYSSSSTKGSAIPLFLNLTATKDKLNDSTIFRIDGYKDANDVNKVPQKPLHSFRLSSRHKISLTVDAEGKEALKVISRKGETGNGEEELCMAFRLRADTRRWKHGLEQAIVAIHATMVLYDLECLRKIDHKRTGNHLGSFQDYRRKNNSHYQK